MSTHTDTLDHSGEHTHEHGWKGYLYILLILLLLTVITVGAAQVNFGSSTANVVIAMTIATIKASLVALFFMHLKDDKPIKSPQALAYFQQGVRAAHEGDWRAAWRYLKSACEIEPGNAFLESRFRHVDRHLRGF